MEGCYPKTVDFVVSPYAKTCWRGDLNPHEGYPSSDFKSDASADSATPAAPLNLAGRRREDNSQRRTRAKLDMGAFRGRCGFRAKCGPNSLCGDAVGEAREEAAHEHQKLAGHRQRHLMSATLQRT
jgi:hypothetical protein